MKILKLAVTHTQTLQLAKNERELVRNVKAKSVFAYEVTLKCRTRFAVPHPSTCGVENGLYQQNCRANFDGTFADQLLNKLTIFLR